VKNAKTFADRFAEITLSARVTIPESGFKHVDQLNTWHPLGGERRLVHWSHDAKANLWSCPEVVMQALASTSQIRMVLATPAIFKDGWKPGWLNDQLEGSPPGAAVKLKLVGVSNGRWKAVSGWSLARINNKGELDPKGKPGPKPIRRMVPAGSVYFFTTTDKAESLADRWLQSVSDEEHERRDGFGLALWGTW
jgi:CRISPR-associated protein Cmr3